MVNLIEMKFMKKLIDTCLLIYLVDSSDEKKHKKVVNWFETISGDEYFISIQNLREFAYVVKKKSLLNNEKLKEYIGLFSDSFNLIYDNLEDIINATKSSKNKYWDSLLIATAKRHNIVEIITENEKDFDGKIKVDNILK